MEKIITIKNKWIIESYNVNYTLELALYPSNAIIAELDTANIKQLTAFQIGFLFSNLEKATIVVKDLSIESSDPIINNNCKLKCYCCFNETNLIFVEPKIYFENEVSKVIKNTEKFYLTFFIETILNNLERPTDPERPEEPKGLKRPERSTDPERPEEPEEPKGLKRPERSIEPERSTDPENPKEELESPNKKQVSREKLKPVLYDVKIDPDKYFIRGTYVKNYKWFSEKILKLLFNPTDISTDYIYEKYEESGYPKKYINRHPMFYNYNLHSGNTSKLIRKKDIYIYLTVNYFPAGVYDITMENNISKCNITQWDDVDNIEQIYNSIKKILDNQFSNDSMFEGIPTLIPYYIYKGSRIERMISWAFITKIIRIDLNIEDDALAIDSEKYAKKTEYLLECKYFDNKNKILIVMLKDCIISKNIPFGMCYDKNNNIVYQYYSKDYLKRQNKILLPNLSID
jgi:hypothetical protein